MRKQRDTTPETPPVTEATPSAEASTTNDVMPAEAVLEEAREATKPPDVLSELDLVRLKLSVEVQERHRAELAMLQAQYAAKELQTRDVVLARVRLEAELSERYAVKGPLKVTTDGKIAR